MLYAIDENGHCPEFIPTTRCGFYEFSTLRYGYILHTQNALCVNFKNPRREITIIIEDTRRFSCYG